MRYGFWLCALILPFLTACSTLSGIDTTVQPVQSEQSLKAWKKRLYLLNTLKAWKLQGRGSLTYADENWPFSLSWVQTGQRYAMHFKNPLSGNLAARLEKGAQGQVSLKSSDGKTYTGSNATNLLKEHMNLNLPVQGMLHWVRGLTSPDYEIEDVAIDSHGRPKKIAQASWVIHYENYEKENYDAMPKKIIMKRDDVTLKLVIKEWQTRYK